MGGDGVITPQGYEDIRQEVLAVCREKVAAMMLRLSIATGHGDSFDDLLGELEAELREQK
jgi:hypothetical protein